MVNALIFDLDGTLINSGKAHINSYVSVLRDYGLNVNTKLLASKFGMIGEDILRELFPELPVNVIKEISCKKRKLFIDYISLIKPLVCVNDFLKRASKKYVLAIATSTSRRELLKILDFLSWKKYFKVLVTSYDVNFPKPAPDILLVTAKKLSLKISDCVFIGDTIFDALAARSAGMRFIGVATGTFCFSCFKKEGFVVYKNFCGLKKLLLSD